MLVQDTHLIAGLELMAGPVPDGLFFFPPVMQCGHKTVVTVSHPIVGSSLAFRIEIAVNLPFLQSFELQMIQSRFGIELQERYEGWMTGNMVEKNSPRPLLLPS